MRDWTLRISWPASRSEVGEVVDALMYTTAASGSILDEHDGTSSCTLYFETSDDRDAAAEQARGIEGAMLTTADVEREDWLASYQQSLVAIEAGTRFIVAPDARLIERGDRIPIIIPQEQAFGTGSHESTRICLALLENLDLSEGSVADIGTGSGILAIAMLKLGARNAVVIDNDPEVFPPLRDNLERNAIDPSRVLEICGTIDALGARTFDVITANILANVILELLPALRRLTHDRSSVIVSGILATQRAEVVAAAERTGFTLRDEQLAGDWWGGRLSP